MGARERVAQLMGKYREEALLVAIGLLQFDPMLLNPARVFACDSVKDGDRPFEVVRMDGQRVDCMVATSLSRIRPVRTGRADEGACSPGT